MPDALRRFTHFCAPSAPYARSSISCISTFSYHFPMLSFGDYGLQAQKNILECFNIVATKRYKKG